VGDVAAEAGLSKGLVFFHFKSKEALLLALLDTLVDWTPDEAPADERAASSADRLLGLVRREMAVAREDEADNELILQFWILGARHPQMLSRLRAALHNYERAFLPAAREAVQELGRDRPGLTPEGLAALSVAVVLGGGLQLSLDPGRFDVALPLAALEALLRGEAKRR
jgi:AcrR family transcriptional regulator